MTLAEKTTTRSAPRAPLVRWSIVLVAAVFAVPVALLTAALSGSLDPAGLGDPGGLVRIGVSVNRSLHHVAAAATVGFLLIAAFLAPEGRSTNRRAGAATGAAISAGVWAATTLVQVVMNVALLLGEPIGSTVFLDSFWFVVREFEQVRLSLIEGGIVLVAAVAALWARSRGALAWTFFIAVAGLVPLSFGGHASSHEGHSQAVTAMMIHLIAACLWVGGLIALVAMRSLLGRSLEVCVRRYSPIAFWSFLAIGGSGVLFAVQQASSWSDLTTPYWIVIWLKVAALGVLGCFGFVQRQRVLARKEFRDRDFVRFAVTEIAIMSVTFGLAVALGRTAPPVSAEIVNDPVLAITGYPEPDPYQASVWLSAWQIEWAALLVALVAVGVYLAAVIRLRRRGDHWSIGWTIQWVLGWALFVYATNGAPGVYGRMMFSMHMVQHMALMMVIPIFLVLAAPITLALRALRARKDKTLGPRELVLAVVHSRWAAFVANPVVAGAVFFGSLVVFYWSDMFEWALTSHVGHMWMMIHFSISGYAFVWALIGRDPGPPKWSAPLRLVILFATLAAHAFFGLSIMQGQWLLAPDYFKALDDVVPWMPVLLEDQQIGGTIAWGIGEMPTLALALLVTLDWFKSDSRDAKRSDRKADRDGEAELMAYNARLQGLADQDRQRDQRNLT